MLGKRPFFDSDFVIQGFIFLTSRVYAASGIFQKGKIMTFRKMLSFELKGFCSSLKPFPFVSGLLAGMLLVSGR